MIGRHGCGFFGVTDRMSLVCFCIVSLDFCCVVDDGDWIFGFLLCG